MVIFNSYVKLPEGKPIIKLYDSIWFLWLSYITRENRSFEKKLLVGGAITILTNMSSSMGRIITYIMEKKTCMKPPTKFVFPEVDHTTNSLILESQYLDVHPTYSRFVDGQQAPHDPI